MAVVACVRLDHVGEDMAERDDLAPEVHRVVEGFDGVSGGAGAFAGLAPEHERLVHVGVVHMGSPVSPWRFMARVARW